MGQNAEEYSLLYAAETFEQFEGLLQFFEKLDNEENDTWWDKLANELRISDESGESFGSVEHDDDSDFAEEYEEDTPMTAKEQQSVPRRQLWLWRQQLLTALRLKYRLKLKKICESC